MRSVTFLESWATNVIRSADELAWDGGGGGGEAAIQPSCSNQMPEVLSDWHMLVYTGKTLPCTGKK